MRLLKYASKEWRKICRRFKWRSIVDKIKCFFVIKRPPTFSEFVGFELQRENDDRAEAICPPSESEEAVIPCIETTGEEHNTEDDDTEKPTYSITIDFTPFIDALNQAAKSVAEWAASFSESISCLSDFAEQLRKGELYAWIWAEKYHPEWCAIYNRTKKRRIKKKIQRPHNASIPGRAGGGAEK